MLGIEGEFGDVSLPQPQPSMTCMCVRHPASGTNFKGLNLRLHSSHALALTRSTVPSKPEKVTYRPTTPFQHSTLPNPEHNHRAQLVPRATDRVPSYRSLRDMVHPDLAPPAYDPYGKLLCVPPTGRMGLGATAWCREHRERHARVPVPSREAMPDGQVWLPDVDREALDAPRRILFSILQGITQECLEDEGCPPAY